MKTEFFITLLASQTIIGMALAQPAEPLSMTAPEVVEVQEEVFKSAPSVTEEVKFLNPADLAVADADANTNVASQPQEFAPATEAVPEAMPAKDVSAEMFGLLDSDDNGYLSDTEIKEYVQKSAELDNLPSGQMAEKIVVALQLLDKCDADKDRSLNPAEAKDFFAEYNQIQ